jgi:hypothetical protein
MISNAKKGAVYCAKSELKIKKAGKTRLFFRTSTY